jgi:hypothetical protein
MDPYLEPWSGRNNPSGSTPDSYWEPLRRSMGDARRYADRMDLKHALPSSLSSTGFCLANPGVEYLVFQPFQGSFTVNLVAGTYSVEWFDPTSGTTTQAGSISAAAGNRTFTPPISSGHAVLYLHK